VGFVTEGVEGPEAPGVAAEVSAGFDPCTDTPREVLDVEGLRNPTPNDSSAAGGIKWDGCRWVNADGYTARIRRTNITVAMVKGEGFPDAKEFSVGGRNAISTRQLEEHAEASCVVNVEMNGGSLEFGLTNPPSAPLTGHLDTCELARNLADKVALSIPAGA
jgi:hypothetical protein